MARILIVEDDTKLREMLRLILEANGYEVMEAANGAIGLEMIGCHRVDLVITDIFMPEMSGIDTILEYYLRSPKTKIIAISGGGRCKSIDYLDLAEKLGAHKVFQKPFNGSDMVAAVQRLLAENESGQVSASRRRPGLVPGDSRSRSAG